MATNFNHRVTPETHLQLSWRLRSRFTLILAFCLAPAFWGCVTPELEEKINEAFATEDTELKDPPGLSAVCYVDRYQQPEADVTKDIDILFVIDSSSSLNEERADIASGIDSFVAALPIDVNYNIGVMLAHGDKTGWGGRLYKKGNEPFVLSSSTQTLEQIRADLQSKMFNVAGDAETDGGEAGLYSFVRALDADNLAYNKSLGFFRDTAALAVVFVSDENDICSEAPEGLTLVPDPQNKELPAKAKYCTRTNPNTNETEVIGPEYIVNRVKAVQGERPYLVSGIVYSKIATVPSGGENEVGYGYLETISLANGAAIDLASGNFATGLNEIGTLATTKLQLKLEFPLTQTNVDPATVETFIDGVFSPDAKYVSELNEVQLLQGAAGGAKSFIDIAYCTKVEDPNGGDPNGGDPNGGDPNGGDPNGGDPNNENPPSNPPWEVVGVDGTSTSTTMTIFWQTQGVLANANLMVGTDPNNLDLITVNILEYEASHVVTITGLAPNTLYYFKAIATDEYGVEKISDIIAKETKP